MENPEKPDMPAPAPSSTALARAWVTARLPARSAAETGSLVTEYGLIAVVGATLAGLAIRWASGGAIAELFAAILTKVKSVVGV